MSDEKYADVDVPIKWKGMVDIGSHYEDRGKADCYEFKVIVFRSGQRYRCYVSVRALGLRNWMPIHAEVGFPEANSCLFNARSNSNMWLNKEVWMRLNPDAEY